MVVGPLIKFSGTLCECKRGWFQHDNDHVNLKNIVNILDLTSENFYFRFCFRFEFEQVSNQREFKNNNRGDMTPLEGDYCSLIIQALH